MDTRSQQQRSVVVQVSLSVARTGDSAAAGDDDGVFQDGVLAVRSGRLPLPDLSRFEAPPALIESEPVHSDIHPRLDTSESRHVDQRVVGSVHN